MSDDLTATFLNIADSSGHGQDHCELVGGDESKANLPNDFWVSPTATGTPFTSLILVAVVIFHIFRFRLCTV